MDKVDYKSIDYTPVKIGVIVTVAFLGLFYQLGLVFALAVIAGLLIAILSCELMKNGVENEEEPKTEA